jgi:hypothetical protein
LFPPAEKEGEAMTSKGRFIPSASSLILILLPVMFTGCGAGAGGNKERGEALRKLNERVAELAKVPDKTQLASEPYIKGKMVLISRGSGRQYVDPASFNTFESVYARSPEEVQTVVIQDCVESRKGTYRTNENPPRELPALSTDCDVTIIDRTQEAVIFKKRFESRVDENAKVLGTTNTVHASTAFHDITAFLSALPRK